MSSMRIETRAYDAVGRAAELTGESRVAYASRVLYERAIADLAESAPLIEAKKAELKRWLDEQRGAGGGDQ